MSFSTDLYNFLENNITTAAKINKNKTDGDYASYLVYQKINNVREYDHDGPAGIATITFQFTAYARRSITAENIIEELKGLIDGFSGSMGTTKIAASFVTREYSGNEEETNFYREEIDVDFQYYK